VFVASDERPIRPCVAHDPAQADLVSAVISAHSRGQCRSRGDLLVAGAGRPAEISECVPTLDDGEAPPAMVDQRHVYRSAWVGRSDGELESTLPCHGGEAQHQLLDLQVAGVGQFSVCVAGELEAQISTKSLRQRKPNAGRSGAAATSLQVAQSLPADAYYLGERGLGESAPPPAGSQLITELDRGSPGALVAEDRRSRPLGSAHADDIGKMPSSAAQRTLTR